MNWILLLILIVVFTHEFLQFIANCCLSFSKDIRKEIIQKYLDTDEKINKWVKDNATSEMFTNIFFLLFFGILIFNLVKILMM